MLRNKLAPILLGIILAGSTTASVKADACGETSCVPAQGAYISHFTGSNCTGTESYYLPYDGYAYQCRTWDGYGECGTIHRTVTNRSYRYNGHCYSNAWPSGNTLSDFVTVYRSTAQPPVACGSASTFSGPAPLYVQFNGSCSYDPDGYLVSYQWDTGEGVYTASSFFDHTYYYPGNYGVWLTVFDNDGQQSSTFLGVISVY